MELFRRHNAAASQPVQQARKKTTARRRAMRGRLAQCQGLPEIVVQRGWQLKEPSRGIGVKMGPRRVECRERAAPPSAAIGDHRAP